MEKGQASMNDKVLKDKEGGSIDLGAEINQVMKKVERAMESVGGLQQGNKMKQVIATDAEEMRKLVSIMHEDESVKAMKINEEGAILLLSSGSSAESGERKRKRKGMVADRKGSVASRLRKKNKKEGKGEDTGLL